VSIGKRAALLGARAVQPRRQGLVSKVVIFVPGTQNVNLKIVAPRISPRPYGLTSGPPLVDHSQTQSLKPGQVRGVARQDVPRVPHQGRHGTLPSGFEPSLQVLSLLNPGRFLQVLSPAMGRFLQVLSPLTLNLSCFEPFSPSGFGLFYCHGTLPSGCEPFNS